MSADTHHTTKPLLALIEEGPAAVTGPCGELLAKVEDCRQRKAAWQAEYDEVWAAYDDAVIDARQESDQGRAVPMPQQPELARPSHDRELSTLVRDLGDVLWANRNAVQAACVDGVATITAPLERSVRAVIAGKAPSKDDLGAPMDVDQVAKLALWYRLLTDAKNDAQRAGSPGSPWALGMGQTVQLVSVTESELIEAVLTLDSPGRILDQLAA